MKRKNSNNTWLFTICIALIAVVFGFVSFIPVNIEFIKPFIIYFDPTKLLSNLPLWIFTNCIIALYSHSEKNNQYHNNVDFINQRKRCRNAYNTYAKLIARIEKIRRTRIIAAVKLHCSLILFSAARAFDICIIGVQILIESKHRIAHTNNARAAV